MPGLHPFSTTFLAFSEPASEAAGGEGHAATPWGGWFAYTLLVIAIIVILLELAKRGLNNRFFTNKWTQRLEQLYLFVENLCVGIIGPHGRKYIPMMMTFWLVIFFGNVVALVMPYSPTADLGFNLGMALISIGYVQYEGIRTNGILGHFSHFAGPKLGPLGLVLNLLIFGIEIVSELMKNVSLSLRLYGNIYGGHEAVTALNDLSAGWPMPFSLISVGNFLLPIKFLTCIVQALIFTLLTCVYLSLVTQPHGEHGHAEAAH